MESYEVKVRVTGDSASLQGAAKQAEASLQGLKQQGGGITQALGGAGAAIAGAFSVAAIGQVAAMAGEIYNTGGALARTQAAFEGFAGGADVARSGLALLREETGGLITDDVLEQAFTKEKMLGIASNFTQAGDLMHMAAVLARTSGEDIGESLETLNQTIVNQSFLRLDNLGISSGDVKTLQAQYMAAGMSSQDAFVQGMIDASAGVVATGEAALNQIGDAGARFGVRWTNIMHQAETTAFIILEGIAEEIDRVATNLDNIGKTNVSTQIATLVEPQIAAAMDSSFSDAFGPDVFSQVIIDTLALTESDPKIKKQADLTAAQVGVLVAQAFKNPMFGNEQIFALGGAPQAKQWLGGLMEAAFDERKRQEQAVTRMVEAEAEARQRAYQAESQTLAFSFSRSQNTPLGGGGQSTAAMFLGLQQYEQQLNGLIGRAQAGGGIDLFDPSQSTQADSYIRQFDYLYEQATRLHEMKLITDDQFAGLKPARGEMDALVKQAGELRQNFDELNNMSLAGLLGQGIQSGKQSQADLGAMVVDYAQSQGMEGPELQSLKDAIGLQVGSQTETSLVMRDTLVPALYRVGEQFGKGALTDAMAALTDELIRAADQGRDPNLNLSKYGYYDTSGGSQTVKPGDTLWGLSRSTGLSYDDLRRQMGLPSGSNNLQPGMTYGGGSGDLLRLPGMPNNPMFGGPSGGMSGAAAAPMDAGLSVIADEAERFRDAAGPASASMSLSASSVSTMAGVMPTLVSDAGDFSAYFVDAVPPVSKVEQILSRMASKPFDVTIRLKVEDKSGILPLLGGTSAKDLEKAMAEATRRNGGRPAGIDSRV